MSVADAAGASRDGAKNCARVVGGRKLFCDVMGGLGEGLGDDLGDGVNVVHGQAGEVVRGDVGNVATVVV
jgi:hypothetical protein